MQLNKAFVRLSPVFRTASLKRLTAHVCIRARIKTLQTSRATVTVKVIKQPVKFTAGQTFLTFPTAAVMASIFNECPQQETVTSCQGTVTIV